MLPALYDQLDEATLNAEAAASGAPRPPEITPLDRYPLNVNDPEATSGARKLCGHHEYPAASGARYAISGTARCSARSSISLGDPPRPCIITTASRALASGAPPSKTRPRRQKKRRDDD